MLNIWQPLLDNRFTLTDHPYFFVVEKIVRPIAVYLLLVVELVDGDLHIGDINHGHGAFARAVLAPLVADAPPPNFVTDLVGGIALAAPV